MLVEILTVSVPPEGSSVTNHRLLLMLLSRYGQACLLYLSVFPSIMSPTISACELLALPKLSETLSWHTSRLSVATC